MPYIGFQSSCTSRGLISPFGKHALYKLHASIVIQKAYGLGQGPLSFSNCKNFQKRLLKDRFLDSIPRCFSMYF